MTVMLRDVSSAFRTKLQADNVELAELIDLTLPNGVSFHWTTANDRVTYTLSGVPTVYEPFPGSPGSGVQEDTRLGVSVVEFVLANSGTTIQNQLLSSDFALSALNIGRVFIDTPDLGRLPMFNGKMGDYSYNRLELSGEGRNIWKSLSVQWPYITYSDKCSWRFGSAGCGFNTASVTITSLTVNVASSTPLNLLLVAGALAAYPNDRFQFGRMTVLTGANSGVVRSIRSHSGDLLGLSHALPTAVASLMLVEIYPGCKKRLIDDCQSLYNNDKNFLGAPWIPISEDAY